IHSFHVGRVLVPLRSLEPVLLRIYDYQWVAVLLLYLRQLADPKPRGDLLLSTIAAVALVIVAYYVFPVVGPTFMFAKEFPAEIPHVGSLIFGGNAAVPEPRNCMPSMHNAWGFVIIWHARPYGWKIRGAAWAIEIATFVTTLGYGFHYLVDI